MIAVDDFAEYLQKESVHCDFFKGYTVSDVFNSWIKQPGYPVVNVHIYRNSGDQDVVNLEQVIYLYHIYIELILHSIHYTILGNVRVRPLLLGIKAQHYNSGPISAMKSIIL